MGKGWPLAPHCGRSAPQKGPLGFAICMTDEFSDEAKEKADENGIILINGLTFASLLVRYGIEVDIR